MKKYVLTGAPCSGKTSVINELRKRGYDVMDEVAREYLENRKSLGYKDMCLCSIDEQKEAEKRMYDIQIERESELEKNCAGKTGNVFFDRSLIDNVAYHLYFSGEIPNYLNQKLSGRYDSVFLLERFTFLNDGIRKETAEEADRIHSLLEKIYLSYNYNPINVPVKKTIEERTDYILDIIRKDENKIRKGD